MVGRDDIEKFLFIMGFNPRTTRAQVLATYMHTALEHKERRILKPTVIQSTAQSLGLKTNNVIQHLFQCKQIYDEKFGVKNDLTPQDFAYSLIDKLLSSME